MLYVMHQHIKAHNETIPQEKQCPLITVHLTKRQAQDKVYLMKHQARDKVKVWTLEIFTPSKYIKLL